MEPDDSSHISDGVAEIAPTLIDSATARQRLASRPLSEQAIRAGIAPALPVSPWMHPRSAIGAAEQAVGIVVTLHTALLSIPGKRAAEFH